MYMILRAFFNSWLFYAMVNTLKIRLKEIWSMYCWNWNSLLSFSGIMIGIKWWVQAVVVITCHYEVRNFLENHVGINRVSGETEGNIILNFDLSWSWAITWLFHWQFWEQSCATLCFRLKKNYLYQFFVALKWGCKTSAFSISPR